MSQLVTWPNRHAAVLTVKGLITGMDEQGEDEWDSQKDQPYPLSGYIVIYMVIWLFGYLVIWLIGYLVM